MKPLMLGFESQRELNCLERSKRLLRGSEIKQRTIAGSQARLATQTDGNVRQTVPACAPFPQFCHQALLCPLLPVSSSEPLVGHRPNPSLLITGCRQLGEGSRRVYEAEKLFGNDSEFPLSAKARSSIAAGRVLHIDHADSMPQIWVRAA
jgi:hypothetical protein